MQLCVALDMDSKKACLDLATQLKDLKPWLKIGMRSFYRDGKDLLEGLREIGDFKLFLDLKLYDIPNTMLEALMELKDLKVDMINVHASAGFKALKLVKTELSKEAFSPLLLAVSALTSFDEEGFFEVYKQNLKKAVLSMSELSFKAGLDGMVCSVHESKAIKEATNDSFLTLCPGIRSISDDIGDQARVASVRDALKAKADFIVVGRPIIKATSPYNAAMKILEEIATF